MPSDTKVTPPPGRPAGDSVADGDVKATRTYVGGAASWAPPEQHTHRHFRLTIAGGGVHESRGERCSIGSHPLNELVIDDPTVSRFHCEIRVDAASAEITDLGSHNGTLVDGVRIREAFLRAGSVLQLGETQLRFDQGEEQDALPLSSARRFGGLVGSSPAMRTVYAVLERIAASDVSVLLDGETGTGKGQAAESIHRASARREAPFIVVDCSTIPANLVESELFGHEKGAFTGADARRVGAFEEASGGTLFLDEIGELPLDVQPKLLRALQNREIRRVGSNRFTPVDLRVIAATNRDLRAEVNSGGFRPDLYFRLAVVKVTLPPLRRRLEDLPEVVDELLVRMRVAPELSSSLVTPALIASLRRNAWPGNVRELRNHLESRLALALAPYEAASESELPPYAEARDRLMANFERKYLETLMTRFPVVAQAARAANVDRVFLYRLLKRQGLKP